MCCFSTKTEVFGTSIFARFVRPGVQGLVYQMQYQAQTPTAMILPLPVALPAKEDSVRFKSLKPYPTFFDDLAKGFPALESGSSRSKGMPASQTAAAVPILAVHDVGDFVASFVPSVDDFARVDPRFAIPREVWNRIPSYADYGFAVFQLKELSGSPHPIALEIDTRMSDALFFPTVHIHDGSVHAQDDFHHVLYAQDARLDERGGDYEGPEHVREQTGMVRSKSAASTFVETGKAEGLIEGGLLLHKSTLRGMLPNRDTTFPLATSTAPNATGCSRCSVGDAGLDARGWFPASAALGGLGWIIHRRNARARTDR